MSYQIVTSGLSLSGQLLDRIASHNTQHDEWQNDQASLTATRQAIGSADPIIVDPVEVMAIRDRLPSQQLEITQRGYRLAERAKGLLRELMPIAEKTIQAAEDQLAKTLRRSLKGLAKMGITIETMPAWPANRQVAERQLEMRAKETSDYKAAVAVLEEAKVARQQIEQQHRETSQAMGEIRERAKRLVVSLVPAA